MDLRLDDINTGHDFGDGMLHLNAWIDLDEVELAGIGIHQIFDRAGADIICRGSDLQRIGRQLLALRFAEIWCRRTLDHLLVTTLDRTIALEQMYDVSMRIAENLALDVAGALDQLFEIDLVLAEGGLRFALGLGHFTRQVFLLRMARMPRPPPPQEAFSMTG